MSDADLKALIADLAREHAKTEAAQQRTEEAHRRTEEAHQRTEEARRRTEETLRRVTAQLGGLGNKFGSFTEGLAFESMEKILRARFHADTITRRVKALRGGRAQEYDMVGVRNGVHNEIYCVEIKSELNAVELEKSIKKFGQFFALLPHYSGMKLYGIISAVDVRGALADRVLHEGIYLATAGDENFKLLKPPRNFQPRVFVARSK